MCAIVQSLTHHEEQEKLKKTITTLVSEKARLIEGKRAIERSPDDFKNSLSCIVCKSLAKFPGQVTPCYHIILCSECGDRWLMMESCPHCRSVVVPGSCLTVSYSSFRSLGMEPSLLENQGPKISKNEA